MKQTEFEKALNGLKADMHRELEAIEGWQVDIKAKMADWHKRRVEAEGAISRLKAEQRGLAARRVEVERKWKQKLLRFKAENYSESRELEAISDYALVKELAKRGWFGTIDNGRSDMAADHKSGVIETFNKICADEEAQADND